MDVSAVRLCITEATMPTPGEQRSRTGAGQDDGRGRYAVLFKAYAWDDFVERQYRRVVASAPGADV